MIFCIFAMNLLVPLVIIILPKVFKRRVQDFYRLFFLKAQPKRHLKKKIVAPWKRVYLDALPSYEAGNYVTIQQNDKKWCKASNFNEKKIIKLSETSKRIDFWKNCRAPIV